MEPTPSNNWANRRLIASSFTYKAAPYIPDVTPTASDGELNSEQLDALRTDFDSWDVQATRFVFQNREKLRYVQSRDMWLYWEGHVWKWDTTGKAQESVKAFGRVFQYPQASNETDEHKKRRVGWYKKLTEPQGIKNILTLAKTDPLMAATLEDFDSVVYELNTPAGVVNLKTGAVTPPDSARLVKRSTTVAPDHASRPAQYENLLAEAFMGQPELSDYFETMMGVTLLKGQQEQVFMYMFGKAGSGKGTLMNLAQKILGTDEDGYATYVDSSILIKSRSQSHPTEYMQFLGARMAVTSEVAESQMDTDKLKKITGGDPIKGRYMGKDYVTFDATHTLWVMANYRLQVPSDDQGVWRRLRVLPFDFAKKESEFTSGLFERIYAEEAAGILARWIRKAGDYLRDGLSEPNSVLQAREDYKKEQDTVSAWMEDCAAADAGRFTRYQALRESYLNWCRQEKKIAVGRRAFPLTLKALGFEDCREYVNDGGERKQLRGYRGIALL